jgi:hypothetical protein
MPHRAVKQMVNVKRPVLLKKINKYKLEFSSISSSSTTLETFKIRIFQTKYKFHFKIFDEKV